MRHADLAFDPRLLAHDERARLALGRPHVAADLAVDAQAPGEHHVALDPRADADQTVDPALRLGRLLSEHETPLPAMRPGYVRLRLSVARGWSPPRSTTRTCTDRIVAFGSTRNDPSAR